MDSSTSAAAAGEAAVPPEDDVCSVCHDRFRIPCQANCSHWFCGKSLPLPCLLSLLAPPRLAPLPPTGINLGECIIRVWNYGPPVQACKCPICRRLINLLVPAALSGQEDGPQAQRILGEIQHYNCIFGGAPRSLTQVEVARPTLLHPKTVQRTNGPPADPPTRVQGADADDGMLGLFGFVDDLLILLIVFLHLAAVYRSLLLYRHGGQ
ncbi:Mitochondrial transcription termination factor family protein [Zea mays]|uniref:Mitochondrial transcription termination factor family protein n=1 Tax=Zea mays TaxID=4577 RepID=A0A1D6LBB7_MAIZE|nr:Mitochondrial transcription termination factor family protein [Zea mays]ONM11397.1 Mitochondrial transcription termination factor family protein [Zea mays]